MLTLPSVILQFLLHVSSLLRVPLFPLLLQHAPELCLPVFLRFLILLIVKLNLQALLLLFGVLGLDTHDAVLIFLV